MGDYYIDGVAFPAEEIVLEFAEPVDPSEELFPTGNLVDDLEVPGIGTFKNLTMITAGIPTCFVNAARDWIQRNWTSSDINNADVEALLDLKQLDLMLH